MTSERTRASRREGIPIDEASIERRLLEQYGTELSQRRGLRRWLLERRVRREVAERVAQEMDRLHKRPASHQIHLF